ncbi:uncharacterized protein LOC130448191 [Diorhabda sublineata]|uniref:uncharacterized protein LOC130448191 n=1 Tax=Diorhabda sublineata TaxID=1163346 RepID=UPI0024E17F84|nr:uncharacterized protein LOC130448191 [Diorhabda sublineata]XP_056641423.1 uncharacterized protein LOC130448191 [Diorhabda sublineata]
MPKVYLRVQDMCKCIQSCLESCYWHLIEERFCFDESIATYQESITKEEKNNNFCDNMAFYDSVSVIAGRAIVTIDPLPVKKEKSPIISQPRKRNFMIKSKSQSSMQRVTPVILETNYDLEEKDCNSLANDSKYLEKNDEEDSCTNIVKKTVSFEDISDRTFENSVADTPAISENTFLSPPPTVETRKKSLMERRQSRSLHLNIDGSKEVPIIRQSSVPKFFLETPDTNQYDSILVKSPLTALQSPIICKDGFCYDLKSVVQIESEKINVGEQDKKHIPLVHRESTSRLLQIKDKIKLKKSKSTVSTSNIPHTNYI